MDKNMLSEYAKLMVKVGANVQKGQKVRLYAEVDQYELATLVAKECYNAGASYVEMFWSCGLPLWAWWMIPAWVWTSSRS